MRIASVHAVAKDVHTRLVPPATNAGSTTSAGSRRMSGQLSVDDKTVAATANATAPTTNSNPVTRRSTTRSPELSMMLSQSVHRTNICTVYSLYDVQSRVKRWR